VKVKQQFSFAFLDKWIIFTFVFLDYKIITLILLRRGGCGNCCDCLHLFNSRGTSAHMAIGVSIGVPSRREPGLNLLVSLVWMGIEAR
jgi:hypothetical protein